MREGTCIGHAYGEDYSGMLFARLDSCQGVWFRSLIVLIDCTEYIGIYLKIMLDMFVEV